MKREVLLVTVLSDRRLLRQVWYAKAKNYSPVGDSKGLPRIAE